MKRQMTVQATATTSTTPVTLRDATASNRLARKVPRAEVLSIRPRLARVLDPKAIPALRRQKPADRLLLAAMIAGFCAFAVTLATSILYPAMMTLVK